MSEFLRLSDLPSLNVLVFAGNPLEEKLLAEGYWREWCAQQLRNINLLDGVPVIRPEK